MSDVNKKVELKDEELENVNGGFTAIGNRKTKLEIGRIVEDMAGNQYRVESVCSEDENEIWYNTICTYVSALGAQISKYAAVNSTSFKANGSNVMYAVVIHK